MNTTSLVGKCLKLLQNHTKSADYEFIAADITNTCNLRCQFCVNDFSACSSKFVPMEKHTYLKMLKLLPLVPDGSFFISCLWEPTLHREFIDFLELIPVHLRNKVLFTTNLTLKLSDDFFQRLSHISLHHINISLDSLNPHVFESLRKGAKFEQFERNLNRLVEAFSQSKDAPPIYYVTMILKSNMEEIPSLVEKLNQKYLSRLNFPRYVYEVSHLSSQWKRENLLSNEDWDRFLSIDWPKNCVISSPPGVYYANDNEPYSRNFAPVISGNLPPALRISSSGDVESFYGKDFHVNLNDLDDPNEFFLYRKD